MTITNYPDHFQADRLLIRPLLLDDALAWTDFFSDERATAFFPKHMKGAGYLRSLHWIEKQIMRYRDGQGGLMAIETEKDGLIGQCGLLVQELEGQQFVEIGYHFIPKFWGNGYASEAANFFRSHYQSKHPEQRIISIIHHENEASKKVALRNQMKLWKQVTWHDMITDIYATEC